MFTIHSCETMFYSIDVRVRCDKLWGWGLYVGVVGSRLFIYEGCRDRQVDLIDLRINKDNGKGSVYIDDNHDALYYRTPEQTSPSTSLRETISLNR